MSQEEWDFGLNKIQIIKSKCIKKAGVTPAFLREKCIIESEIETWK